MEGNLRIRKIRIRNLGTVDELTLVFNKRIAMVEGTAWQEILLAFRIVCGDILSVEEKNLLSTESRIEAVLQLDHRQCTVLFQKEDLTGEIRQEIKPAEGTVERNIRQYLRDIPERRRLRVLHDPEGQRIVERFSDYEAEEKSEQENLFHGTAGLCVTSAFRELLKEMPVLNPEEEKVLNAEDDQCLCYFFKLNRFWELLDRERGINQGAGPLIIAEQKNRIERKGTKPYMQEMRKQYDGQLVIVLVPSDQKAWDKNGRTEVV